MNIMPFSDTRAAGQREDGHLPLEEYGVLGEGRSVAFSGADGSIDWWCVPNMDSPPLFDRLLDAERGGYFAITPKGAFSVERHYRCDSNVLETTFTTPEGCAMIVESLNSSSAGRLPWGELARRVEGLEGTMTFEVCLRFGRRADNVSPYMARAGKHQVFHVGRVLGLFLASDGVTISRMDDEGVVAALTVAKGRRETLALVVGEDEPLVVPPINDIDGRIDCSDEEWRTWARSVKYSGEHREQLIRSALALKLLLFSPSGAIAAAATTSLPERIGGDKNFDYRYAWVRDAGSTIEAFLAVDAQAEAKAAFSWLLRRLEGCNPRVLYTLDGDAAPDAVTIDVPGYRGSAPVLRGNIATDQHQHGIYGDIFGTAERFVAAGNILDGRSATTLSQLADLCADHWRQKDHGIWELKEVQHYTTSKISCWQALARAVELADEGQLPTTCRDRWARERDRIAAWIEEHCWSDERQAYTMYPGSKALDASVAVAVRLRFDGQDRLLKTLDAIDKELKRGPFHHRYSGMDKEEGCFLACSFWILEARALLGQKEEAEAHFRELMEALDRGVGVLSEMVDPEDGSYLGNMPQGLTHLAIIHAIQTLSGHRL
jgi:GH15 family glucan-1,4-alpha-glucosidase